MNEYSITAAQAGLLSCHLCAQLTPAPPHGVNVACPRCGSALHSRKPESVTRTWALLLTATILYLPANLLPVMTVIKLGNGEPSTILGGVAVLFREGMWVLALVIFFASVVVPLLKLTTLSFLLFTVQRNVRWNPKDRTMLYQITENFGHWSMVDIFAVATLIALVDMETFSTILPGAGAAYFGAVVVLTMLAARSFDPRLIWDAVETRHE